MHLLVVDDDPPVRAIIVDALEACGHSVVTATNGAEAFVAFQKEVFRLVITDWQMPKMDGPALRHAIRSSRSPGHTYIIMLTALHGPGNVVSGLDAGAEDYLPTPFAPEELCARVRAGERLLAIETRNLVLRALAELVEFRDNETGEHIKRVQHCSRVLAQHLCDHRGHDPIAGWLAIGIVSPEPESPEQRLFFHQRHVEQVAENEDAFPHQDRQGTEQRRLCGENQEDADNPGVSDVPVPGWSPGGHRKAED